MVAKYVFITGGVVSSLGKGITAASLGCLLKSRGFKVTIQKLDPYINVDPGTMSPYQHGEIFVTDDGTETDMDLGHYERFIDANLTKNNNVTTGKIYWSVINKERRGEYGGGTVQVIPHITNEIKASIKLMAEDAGAEVVICEIGGTVGDIESLPFLEAIRQMKTDLGKENVCYIHVTLIPYLEPSEELKTKPTQHSVKELRGIGIQPDVIVCRTEYPLTNEIKDKIALFCDINAREVVENKSSANIYEVPLILKEEGLDKIVLEKIGLPCKEAELSAWEKMVRRINGLQKKLTVALVGKYTAYKDSYTSLIEALNHAGAQHDVGIEIRWIGAEQIEALATKKEREDLFAGVQGIVVPGGFGERGIEGKIEAARFAREKKVPFLGLCLGMHCAIIEVARNVCGLQKAHSLEFDPQTPEAVIEPLPGREEQSPFGERMRLGLYPCTLLHGSKAYQAYQKEIVKERHRHDYKFNNSFQGKLASAGLFISGFCPDDHLAEIVELKDHPWYVATQFHPEFKSRPNRPHPLFMDFINAQLNTSYTPPV